MRQLKKRKTRAELNEEGRERKRQKKQRGNSAGSRANPNAKQTKTNRSSSVSDPRLGSKKPIDLTAQTDIKAEKSKKAKPEKLAPEKELELLENDTKLDDLLIRLENDDKISEEEQEYVDNTLDRIDELMTLLGIELEDELNESESSSTKEPDIMQLLKQKG